MKIAIVGSRTWPAQKVHLITEFVNSLPDDTIVISGGAKGVDQWAEYAARKRGLRTQVFIPDWDRHQRPGKKNPAGMIRNQQIVDTCDALVAFQVGNSAGTEHSIQLARKQGKLRAIYHSDDQI